MNRPSQNRWFRRDSEPDELAPPAAGDAEETDPATRRIAAYAGVSTSDVVENVERAPSTEATPPPSRSAGEEVDAILQIARESAAKLTKAATEEAERTRTEANEAAARELEQAEKVRADAEAHAGRLRKEAETEAEKVRGEAESEATSLIEAARAKVAAADAEAEQKVRAAEESARARVDALKDEARRHEEGLELLLGVLRGMSLQVEGLLGGGDEDGHGGAPAEDRAVDRAAQDLDEALRPNAQSEPVT
jgi:membrane protein involved in colicin uptake